MGTIAFTNIRYESDGSYGRIDAHGAFGSSYNNTGNIATTGETVNASALGFSQIISIDLPSEAAGFGLQVLGLEDGPSASCRIKVFQGGSGTTGGTSGGTPSQAAGASVSNAPSAVTGTGTFTGTSPVSALDLASPAFSGTGCTAAGQVITTTDNQTMTLNQCAGMWLIQATQTTPPNLILSNTAVNGAPAVLTVQGVANTDAGAYQIVKALTPVGTVSALNGTAAAQVATVTQATYNALGAHTHSISATAGGEIANATDLHVLLAKVQFTVFGK